MIKINVTREHINRGRKKDCLECPIALAVKSFAPGTKVAIDKLFFSTGKSLKLPAKITNWIKDFDNNLKVGLISFEIPEFY
jgi:hypothetical protein